MAVQRHADYTECRGRCCGKFAVDEKLNTEYADCSVLGVSAGERQTDNITDFIPLFMSI